MIDFSQTIKTLDGQPLKENNTEITLKMVSVNALLEAVTEKAEGMEKVKRYILATKIYKEDKLNLSSEDITLIKASIALMYKPIVVGQAWELLEK